MQKCLSNLIILSLVFTGLALASPEIDRQFFSEVITAPPNQSVSSSDKGRSSSDLASGPSNQTAERVNSQNEVQIAPKNDTIKDGANESPGTSSGASSGLTWEVFNQMSQSQLESINGVGPVLAKRILDYRSAHGPFQSFNELDQVKGIGPKLLEKIKKEFITP